MLKAILLFSILTSNFGLYKDKNTSVEYINYNADEISENRVPLEIKINAYKYDLLELKIYFYNKNKQLISEDFFCSSLSLNSSKKTIANIPYRLKEETYFNIIIVSHTDNREILNIMFPVYVLEKGTCNLNLTRVCQSKYPVSVKYENNEIREVREKISVINESLSFYADKNMVPLRKLAISSNVNLKDNLANLYLEEENPFFDIYYNKGYMFPVLLSKERDILSLEFANLYYIDVLNGKMHENYKEGTIQDNKVILPYINNCYEFILKLEKCTKSFNEVVVKFDVFTNKKLIGNKQESLYSIRRKYL